MRDIQTTLMGNATADPSSRQHEDGSTTTIVRIAVTGRYYDSAKSDFTDRKTEFVSVYTRRALARNVLASVKKGQPLVVTGRLGSSEWQADDGTQRHTLTLQAEAIGHDLTFGTTAFARPVRPDEVPDVDRRTGEVLGSESGGLDVAEELTGSPTEDSVLAGAS